MTFIFAAHSSKIMSFPVHFLCDIFEIWEKHHLATRKPRCSVAVWFHLKTAVFSFGFITKTALQNMQNRAHATVPFVVTMALSRVVSAVFKVEKCRDLEIWIRAHARSLKVAPFDRQRMVSFLVFYSNFVPETHRF